MNDERGEDQREKEEGKRNVFHRTDRKKKRDCFSERRGKEEELIGPPTDSSNIFYNPCKTDESSRNNQKSCDRVFYHYSHKFLTIYTYIFEGNK